MDDRWPQFIRQDAIAVALARGIGIDFERIHVTRRYDGNAIYVKLDRPKLKELYNAAYFLLPRRPYGIPIIIYEGTEEWHTKLHLEPAPWETTDLQNRRAWEMQLQEMRSYRMLIESLAIPEDLLQGADPPGLQA